MSALPVEQIVIVLSVAESNFRMCREALATARYLHEVSAQNPGIARIAPGSNGTKIVDPAAQMRAEAAQLEAAANLALQRAMSAVKTLEGMFNARRENPSPSG